ncbi:hypothetical protein T10_4228 [Trichinella papuae]|uniref:Uncharacterized protein n=1 Tax=Trichinella papuae TaxID=268474 RepID=A0A0V1M697_9BILA|nr:hypothetical protein T10_4228 [Trichinella papuae]
MTDMTKFLDSPANFRNANYNGGILGSQVIAILFYTTLWIFPFEECATVDDQLQVTYLISDSEITNSIAKTNDDADNSSENRSKSGLRSSSKSILYCASWRLILMRRIMELCQVCRSKSPDRHSFTSSCWSMYITQVAKNSRLALLIFTAGYGLCNSSATDDYLLPFTY